MSFMFKALEEKEKDVVIGAMEEIKYEYTHSFPSLTPPKKR